MLSERSQTDKDQAVHHLRVESENPHKLIGAENSLEAFAAADRTRTNSSLCGLTQWTDPWPAHQGAQASASCCSTERVPYRADRGFLASRSQVDLGLCSSIFRPHSSSRP